jgi:hypothetical protein
LQETSDPLSEKTVSGTNLIWICTWCHFPFTLSAMVPAASAEAAASAEPATVAESIAAAEAAALAEAADVKPGHGHLRGGVKLFRSSKHLLRPVLELSHPWCLAVQLRLETELFRSPEHLLRPVLELSNRG